MDWLISDAMAAPAAAAQTPGFAEFIPLIILFAIFYFMLIRPQMKRQKEQKALVDSIKKGDEVIISGGLLGTITKVGDNFVQIKLAEDVEVKAQRSAITALMPKGTVKTL